VHDSAARRYDAAREGAGFGVGSCIYVRGCWWEQTESSEPASAEYELRNVVEPALARALVLAAEAQRWELVAQIATELAARRRTERFSLDAIQTGTFGAGTAAARLRTPNQNARKQPR